MSLDGYVPIIVMRHAKLFHSIRNYKLRVKGSLNSNHLAQIMRQKMALQRQEALILYSYSVEGTLDQPDFAIKDCRIIKSGAMSDVYARNKSIDGILYIVVARENILG